MKSKSFLLLMLITAILIYGVHFLLLHNRVVSYNWFHFNLFDIIVLVIFLLTSLIAANALKQKSEDFVMKFMLVTTLQFLSVLAIIAAIIFAKLPQSKIIALNVVSVFFAMLMVQSVSLILALRSKS